MEEEDVVNFYILLLAVKVVFLVYYICYYVFLRSISNCYHLKYKVLCIPFAAYKLKVVRCDIVILFTC